MPSHLKFGCLVEAPDPTLAWWAIGCIQPIYTFRFIITSQSWKVLAQWVPIIKSKSKSYCLGRCGFAFHGYFPYDKSRKIPMETNARTMILISGRIIGTHCDRRDAWPCHWWKKEGLLYIPNKSGRKYGIYGQTWQCLMKKTPPHEKTGTSAPSALHNPPFAPVPTSSPFLRIPYPCFHGMFLSRKTSLSDIWWHLMTPDDTFLKISVLFGFSPYFWSVKAIY